MSIFRLIIAVLLLCFALFVTVANWMIVISNYRNRRKGVDKWVSPIPMVTVILCILAGPIFPSRADLGFDFPTWVFLPIITDPGGLWMFLRLPFILVCGWFKIDRKD